MLPCSNQHLHLLPLAFLKKLQRSFSSYLNTFPFTTPAGTQGEKEKQLTAFERNPPSQLHVSKRIIRQETGPLDLSHPQQTLAVLSAAAVAIAPKQMAMPDASGRIVAVSCFILSWIWYGHYSPCLPLLKWGDFHAHTQQADSARPLFPLSVLVCCWRLFVLVLLVVVFVSEFLRVCCAKE